jgi:hypothetical protein
MNIPLGMVLPCLNIFIKYFIYLTLIYYMVY